MVPSLAIVDAEPLVNLLAFALRRLRVTLAAEVLIRARWIHPLEALLLDVRAVLAVDEDHAGGA